MSTGGRWWIVELRLILEDKTVRGVHAAGFVRNLHGAGKFLYIDLNVHVTGPMWPVKVYIT